jgi:hypothetical protein
MLKDGEIQEMGSYQRLLKSNGVFADFIGTYLQNNDDTSK